MNNRGTDKEKFLESKDKNEICMYENSPRITKQINRAKTCVENEKRKSNAMKIRTHVMIIIEFIES